MSDSLASKVAGRTFPYAARATLGALGLGLVSAAIVGSVTHSRAQAAERPPGLDLASTEAIAVKALTESNEAAVADPRAHEVQFVIAAGGAKYIALAAITQQADADAADEPESDPALADYSTGMHTPSIRMPKHGTARLASEGDAQPAITVATVKPSDVPESYREWLDRKVELGGHCTTAITGFAIVTQVAGYADFDDSGAEQWTAKTITESGSSVLAAKLADGKCDAIIARDAALSHAVVLDAVPSSAVPHADALIAEARAQLVASPAGAVAAEEWKTYAMPGQWDTGEGTTWETQLYVHPNGSQYLLVHASNEQGCGGVDLGLVAIYQLEIDGRHTHLVPVTERTLQGVSKLEQVVDLAGDGQLQIVGRGWLGLDHVITTAAGAGITVLDLPFVGCPC